LPTPNIIAELKHQYFAPSSDTESAMVQIWSELLKIERIGIRDSFLELGGHSLLATQLITRVNIKFKINLPLIILFEADTIEKLSEKVDFSLWVKKQEYIKSLDNDMEYEDIEI